MKVIEFFDADEDVVYGDLNWSNPCGYEVNLVLDAFGNVKFIGIESDDDSVNMSIRTWRNFGLVLSDADLFDKYSQQFMDGLDINAWDMFANPEFLCGVL